MYCNREEYNIMYWTDITILIEIINLTVIFYQIMDFGHAFAGSGTGDIHVLYKIGI